MAEERALLCPRGSRQVAHGNRRDHGCVKCNARRKARAAGRWIGDGGRDVKFASRTAPDRHFGTHSPPCPRGATGQRNRRPAAPHLRRPQSLKAVDREPRLGSTRPRWASMRYAGGRDDAPGLLGARKRRSFRVDWRPSGGCQLMFQGISAWISLLGQRLAMRSGVSLARRPRRLFYARLAGRQFSWEANLIEPSIPTVG